MATRTLLRQHAPAKSTARPAVAEAIVGDKSAVSPQRVPAAAAVPLAVVVFPQRW